MCYTPLCSGFSVDDTNSNGFVLIVEQLDRFDVVVMEKPLFVLPSELFYLFRNSFHFESSIRDVPRCMNDVMITLF
jgi:hypothetical protein